MDAVDKLRAERDEALRQVEGKEKILQEVSQLTPCILTMCIFQSVASRGWIKVLLLCTQLFAGYVGFC
jgi:hypothetical protein